MDNWFYKFVRVTVILTLAISPLRGVIASSGMLDTNMDTSHVQTHHQMPASSHLSERQDITDGGSEHDCCNQVCDSGCCESACNTCVHFTPGITGIISSSTDFHDVSPVINITDSFNEHSVPPLLQPPISIPV